MQKNWEKRETEECRELRERERREERKRRRKKEERKACECEFSITKRGISDFRLGNKLGDQSW